MMRCVVFDLNDRPRPALKTPAPCEEGDRCVKSDVVHTDIDAIIRRFAGNLAEIKAWQSGLKYGEQLDADLTDLHEMLREAHDRYDEWKDSPFGSFAEAAECWANGTFDSRVSDYISSKTKKTEVNTDETPENTSSES